MAARHELTSSCRPSRITVAGDAVRLTQVFANLLTNAAKYTNAGGHIRLSRATTRAIARSCRCATTASASPAHLDSVFDMFMQVDRSNRRAQGGLGIGLTLVRSLVEMHGGRVEARSEGPGTGSEFIVKLPLSDCDASASRARRPRSRPFPPRRILVVDDNRDAAETLGDAARRTSARRSPW